jgi:hypothetical protein
MQLHTERNRDTILKYALERIAPAIDRVLASKRSVNLDDRAIVELAIGAQIGSHATARIVHSRPRDLDVAGRPILAAGFDILDDIEVDEAFGPLERAISLHDHIEGMKAGRVSESEAANLIINVGRILMHRLCYDTSRPTDAGINYTALSPDTVSGNETATSTTLSNERTTLGLARAQATVTVPTGSGTQTTLARTFTKSGGGSAVCRKAALFSASSGGTMQHVLDFGVDKTLTDPDTLAVTHTITLAA